MDISGWTVSSGVDFTFKPGTVIPAGGSVYVARNVHVFRSRAISPTGDEGHFVQGNFAGQLSARGETLELRDATRRLLTMTNYPGNPSLAQQFLRITEIMYHPSPLTGNTNSPEQFEYLELRNISPSATLDLTGVRLTNGVVFDFTGSAVTGLAPGARVLVVRNQAEFTARYGTGWPVAGEYAGALENNGQRLQLLDASGEEILDFSYDNQWYPVTDGQGFSLVVVNENVPPDDWNSRTNWRASGTLDGTPGASESALTNIPPVVINELLTASTPPNVDAIELFNPTTNTVNMGGWFLSDDFNTPKKFRIPDSTTIAPHGFAQFTEADFNPAGSGFALSSDGDEVWLFSGDGASNLTGYMHGFRFGAAEGDVPFGRYVNSTGDEFLVAESTSAFLASNAPPRVGPVVISEIMYHPVAAAQMELDSPVGRTLETLVPGGLLEDQFEFIELHNIAPTNVPLFDLATPANTWRLRNAVDFDFPSNVVLPTNGSLLVVGFDPASDAQALALFRSAYGLDSSVPIFGPWNGRLDNAGETIELQKPNPPVGTNLAHVLVEAVSYGDAAPWPASADGTGLSLSRVALTEFGNEPTNWIAAAPTPGTLATNLIPPVIVSAPASQFVSAYDDVAFSVDATGAPPLHFQWRLNGVAIHGATNAALSLPGVTPGQAGDYSVLVFNAAGSALSSSATLAITAVPVIYAQPANQAVNPGGTATFSVFAVGAGALTYQWLFNGTDLPGETSTNLTVVNVQGPNAGAYTVEISDALGSVVSQPAMLIVLVKAAVIEAPQSQTVVQGDTASFRVVVNSDATVPIGFRWRHGVSTVTNIVVNGPECIFTLPNVGLDDAGNYSVIITNAAGLLFAPPATLTVLADFDGDHLPDVWEAQYGFNTNSVNDANADPDSDGMSNRGEYIAGTDPTNALSYLKIDSLAVGNGAVLTFLAVSNRNYTVEFTDALDRPWQKLTDIPVQATNRIAEATDATGRTNRFYRLVIPQSP